MNLPSSVLAPDRKWWVSAETRAKNAANVLLAAEAAAAREAVAGEREAAYRETWGPLLARRALPKYIVVPAWATGMHGREMSDA
jgi:hypothetical protein